MNINTNNILYNTGDAYINNMINNHISNLNPDDYGVYKQTISSLNDELNHTPEPYDADMSDKIEYITNDYTKYMLNIDNNTYMSVLSHSNNSNINAARNLSDLYIV